MKVQWKEGVLTVASGTTILEFFKLSSSRGGDDETVVARNEQHSSLVRFTCPHDRTDHPESPEDGLHVKIPEIPEHERINLWRYDMSCHKRDETIFELLKKERKELEAERPGNKVEQEELIITLQWWRVS